MRNKSFYLVIGVALLLGSCKSSGSDSSIATDMCGCFNMLKDSLPPAAMGVFEKAAVAENPKEAFGKEIQKLDPEAAQKVTAALMATAKTGSPINDWSHRPEVR